MDNTTRRKIAVATAIAGISVLAGTGCTGTVPQQNVSGISLDCDEMTMTPGESLRINATVESEDGSGTSVTWITSEPSVATVSDGLVSALAPGTAFITASAGGCYATAIVEVNAIGGIVINDNEITLKTGESRSISFTVTPQEGSDDIVWTTSDPSVATVENGTVTAIAEGQAVITAGCSDIAAECPVYVTGDPDIGDYMYSDGTFSANIFDRKQAVGIVYWLGDPTADDALLKRDFPQCTHGLAAALTEENGSWQKEYYIFESTVSEWADENFTEGESPLTGYDPDSPLNSTVGYNNTKAIEAFNADPANISWKVDAVKRLLFYKGESRYQAPEGTSGWYLPSAKELSLMCVGEYDGNIWEYNSTDLPVRDLLNGRLNMLGGAHLLSPELYWSSSEYDARNAFCVGFYNGKTPYNIKGAMNVKIRYVLAF